MTYYAKPNFIEYDDWFDENIDPLDLKYYFDEKKYSNTVHEKFYDLSSKKLVIGSSDKFIELNSLAACSLKVTAVTSFDII